VARWVLWPVFVWRVVAQVPADRPVNVFQRAVLGLARAGVRTVSGISDRLLIAPKLASLIVLELRNASLVDHAGAPTERGLAVLEDVEQEPEELASVGHVLADALGGKLWPCFLAGDLPIAEAEPDDGRVVLRSGSAGDPWRDPTFSVRPTQLDPVVVTRPDVRDVLRAARGHQRRRHLDEVADDAHVPDLARVSFVEDAPQPYWFALRVRTHESGDWMVDDPFGPDESVWLRERIEARLDVDGGLRRWIERVVVGDGSGSLTALHAEAVWRVEDRLTLGVRQHPDALDRLVVMQRALLEAEQEGAPRDKWDDVLVKAQRAAERVLHAAYRQHLIGGARSEQPLSFRLADADVAFNRLLLDRMAQDLGFHTPLPHTLSSVRSGKVQAAEHQGGGSLRPLVLLALLCADQDPAHPLRRAGPRWPDLLHRLDALASARDRAAHDGVDTTRESVPEHVETAFLAVEALILTR
jgi:hypothetical protein